MSNFEIIEDGQGCHIRRGVRYKLVNIDAKIHLINLNIAYLTQVEREKS